MLIILCADGMITPYLIIISTIWTRDAFLFHGNEKNKQWFTYRHSGTSNDLPEISAMDFMTQDLKELCEVMFPFLLRSNECTITGLTPTARFVKSSLNSLGEKPPAESGWRMAGSLELDQLVLIHSATVFACGLPHKTVTWLAKDNSSHFPFKTLGTIDYSQI